MIVSRSSIENGFGSSPSGEDAFDSFIGLLGIIEAISELSGQACPEDPWVRNIEGWTLGTDSSDESNKLTSRSRPVKQERWRDDRRETMVRQAKDRTAKARLCPACGKKEFARWPWGWDGHAAHNCTGIVGDTPEDRRGSTGSATSPKRAARFPKCFPQSTKRSMDTGCPTRLPSHIFACYTSAR